MSQTIPELIDVAIPINGENITDTPPNAGDPSCRVCGTPLVYGGRGRRPTLCEQHKQNFNSNSKPRTGTVKGNTNVEQAVSRMEMLYAMVIKGVTMVDRPTAMLMAAATEQALEMDRQAFIANPKLAAQINKTSSNAGTLTFIAAQGIAFGPVAMLLYTRMPKKTKEAVAAEGAQTGIFRGFGTA